MIQNIYLYICLVIKEECSLLKSDILEFRRQACGPQTEGVCVCVCFCYCTVLSAGFSHSIQLAQSWLNVVLCDESSIKSRAAVCVWPHTRIRPIPASLTFWSQTHTSRGVWSVLGRTGQQVSCQSTLSIYACGAVCVCVWYSFISYSLSLSPLTAISLKCHLFTIATGLN